MTGFPDPSILEFASAPKTDTLPQSLTDKIAMMLIYCENLRARTHPRDTDAFDSLLDDPEVAAWLTKMRNTGRGRNTRFTG